MLILVLSPPRERYGTYDCDDSMTEMPISGLCKRTSHIIIDPVIAVTGWGLRLPEVTSGSGSRGDF